MSEYKLVMKEIHKVYEANNIVALCGANLFVKRGTIHALVGENGAGKTTMMKILCGIERMNKGSIFLDGKEIDIRNAKQAFKAGIGMVHQHFRLIEDFTVAENVTLGLEKTGRFGFVTRNEIYEEVVRLSRESGLELNPELKVSCLSIGQRQKVEILRTLYRGADLIILDEPTSVLTEQEIEELFNIIKMLQKQGKTLIFISHKLEEVLQVSDEITILRNGRNVASGNIEDFDRKRISYLMVGENIDFEKITGNKVKGERIFKVEDLRVKDRNDLVEAVRGVSFEISRGEILGVVGVAGNGQIQLVEALVGLKKISSGKVILKGKELTNRSVREIREAGLAYIPEDRINEGTSCDSSILENIIATKYYKKGFSNKGWINKKISLTTVKELMNKYEIKAPSPAVKVGMLSGGNIQKVIISREFSAEPEVLIVCEPTWGLDVRSIKFVYDSLNKMRTEGKAVLIVSSNLDEILYLADRILVMYRGEFVASLDNSKDLTKSLIGEYMMGLHLTEKN